MKVTFTVLKNLFSFKSLIISVLSICLSSPLYCQQNKAEAQSPVQTITLDEVVISANKVLEPVKKISQAVKILTSTSVQGIAPATAAEILSSGAGICVQKSQQGGGSPNIRGFEANRILLVVDGVRMNNLIFRGGHLQNIITVDPSILDKVEILFGPSSTVYGSDALGGTLHLITKDPVLADVEGNKIFKVNSFARYASANTGVTTHVDFNLGSEKFGSLSSFTFNKFGDLRMGWSQNPFYKTVYWERPYYMERFGAMDSMVANPHPLIQKYSGYNQTDLLQKFIVKPNDRVLHRINLQFSTSTDIPRYDRLTETSSHGLKYAQWYYGPQVRFLSAYDLTLKQKFGFDQVHLGLSAQYLEESRHSRKTGADYLTHRHEFVSVGGGNLDLLKTWNKHDLRLGAELQLNSLTSAACDENVLNGTNIPTTSRYPDGDNRMNFIDVYTSHRWDINDHWSFNQGLRLGYSSIHSSFENMELFPYPFKTMKQENATWSGALGLVYLPSSSLKLSFTLSSGYRVPNIDDLAKIFERPANTVVVPNPDVKPETTYNADLGISKTWNSAIRWETNVFGTLYNDIIVISPSTYQGADSILFDGTLCKVLSGQNKNTAYIYGLSSSISGKICRSFSLDAGIYYTRGRIKEDEGEKPMSSIAPLSGKIGAGYQYKSWSASFFVLFNGWKLIKDYYLSSEDNEAYATAKGMPAWFTLNLRLECKVNKYVGVQLGIDNILDTQYRVFASGINAPGRNILGTVRFSL